MDFKNKKLLLIVSSLALIGVIFIIWYSIFKGSAGTSMSSHGFCPRMIPNYLLWLSIVLVITVVVPMSYYLISKKLDEKMENNIRTIMKLVDSNTKPNVDIDSENKYDHSSILKLLNPNEKLVVESIIKRGGSILQSEISRMDNMTKLKAHRAIKELGSKNLIIIEPHGKTNRIILKDDIKKLVQNE